MTVAAHSLSPAAAGLCRLLDAALADGHTVMPVALAGSGLGGARLRLEHALGEVGPAGSGLISAPTPSLLGFRRVVEAERAIARAVASRADAGRLRVVAGPAGAPREAAAGAGAAVADDAELLDVETLAAFFAACDEDENVVLAGDSYGLGSPGAGRGFADIAGSGLADVVTVHADPAAVGGRLIELADALSRGELPAIDDPAREVVVVAASSAAEATHRALQLVSDSIPRAVGVASTEVQVLTPLATGPGGVAALGAALAGTQAPPPLTVHDALGRRWAGVVLVLPPESAGLLTRPLIYSAVTRATRHLSIVQAAGGALSAAVKAEPRRRRTLLPALLAGHSSSRHPSSGHSSSGD